MESLKSSSERLVQLLFSADKTMKKNEKDEQRKIKQIRRRTRVEKQRGNIQVIAAT